MLTWNMEVKAGDTLHYSAMLDYIAITTRPAGMSMNRSKP
jgi:hypothetical protein